MKFNFTIFGEIPNSKNTLRFNYYGKPYHDKDKVNKYKEYFVFQTPSVYKLNINKPVKISLNIFKKDNRKDGQNMSACVYDAIAFAGIIKNDRLVVERHEYDFIDKQSPRVEVFIEIL